MQPSSDDHDSGPPSLALRGPAQRSAGGGEMHQIQDAQVTAMLARASAGDQQAWRWLVRAYAPRVFAMIQSRLRNADVAEDLTQSVFATLVLKLGSGEYAEQGRFESWLFRIAMNRARDVARGNERTTRILGKRSGQQAIDQTCATAPSETPDRVDAHREAMALLRRAMELLSDSDREVLELRHHGGLSFKQMADVLDEPVGTLLARHHRALQKLRERFESDNPDAFRALGLLKAPSVDPHTHA